MLIWAELYVYSFTKEVRFLILNDRDKVKYPSDDEKSAGKYPDNAHDNTLCIAPGNAVKSAVDTAEQNVKDRPYDLLL